MSERWWRVKNGAVHNRKLQTLPGEIFKAWFNINCLASENGGVVPSIDDVAFALRMTKQKAAAVIAQLHVAKLLDKEGDVFVPHDWDAHQFKNDETKSARGKDSYVYVIGGSWESSALKIGFSKNPWARICELQTAHHEKLQVLAAFRCKASSEVDIHEVLKVHRKKGEWFTLPRPIKSTISAASDRSDSYENLVAELRTLLRSATTDTETETKSETEIAEPIGSSAVAPAVVDYRRDLFGRGLKTLGQITGKGPDACRSFVGKCLKAAGDDAVTVLGLIEDAERNRVVDPASWIAARLKSTGPPAQSRPITDFQRSRNETRNILDDLDIFANRSGGSPENSGILPGHSGERPEGLRGGTGAVAIDLPAGRCRASG